jgi:hypothetical protein
MEVFSLIALFVFTLGAFAYGTVVWLWLRQYAFFPRSGKSALLPTSKEWVIVFALMAMSRVFPDALGYTVFLGAMVSPLLFLFVGKYFGNRYEFDDLFVKRGLALATALLGLTVFFALVLPLLDQFAVGPSRPLVYALALLPLAMSWRWLSGVIARRLDRFWFGRQHTPIEALRHFLSSCYPSATSEDELVKRAEGALSSIFDAPATVVLETGQRRATGIDAGKGMQVVVGPAANPTGTISLAPRMNQTPYFSEDVELMTSLADVFWYRFENIRLHRRKQEQETLATEAWAGTTEGRTTAQAMSSSRLPTAYQIRWKMPVTFWPIGCAISERTTPTRPPLSSVIGCLTGSGSLPLGAWPMTTEPWSWSRFAIDQWRRQPRGVESRSDWTCAAC